MDSLIIYFLPTILALGIITSYGDVKEGKIRNKYIISAIVLGVITHILLFFFGLESVRMITSTGVSQLIVLIIGASLWYFSLWAAGDAKLYFAFALLFPGSNNLISHNFIYILVNTFLPLLVILLVQIIVNTKKKHKIMILKESTRLKSLAKTLLVIFSLSWIVKLVLTPFLKSVDMMITIILIRVIRKGLKKLLKNCLMIAIVVISIVRFVFDKTVYSPGFWIGFIFMTLLYVIFFSALTNAGKYLYKKVRISDLKPGMRALQVIKRNGARSWNIKKYSKDSLFVPGKDGLRKKDIKYIQKLYRNRQLKFNHLKTEYKIPFAPYLFFGTLITTIINDNLFSYLIRVVV